MTWNVWLGIAAINGALSVAAGAFGAHSLKNKVSSDHLEAFLTGARYHMYHALALIAVAWLMTRAPSSALTACAWLFLIGMLLFSGSLYALTLTGIGKFGMITPLGGAAFILAWSLLAWSAFRTPA